MPLTTLKKRLLQVSVIIPVYNAASYVKEAVQSALMQPETAEVILVDDGSTDGSYEICQQLTQNPKVQLYTHPNHENKGAGASRNLGMRQASSEFLTFLDADDYYLKNRFAKAKEVFQKHPDADGTYELMELCFDTIQGKRLYKKNRGHTQQTYHIKANIPPEKLFDAYVLDEASFMHFTMVIKKDSLTDDMYYREELKQVQDIDFCLNWTLNRRLYPANIETPVLIYRIHNHNTIHNNSESRKYGYMAYRIWYDKLFHENWSKPVNRQITRHLLDGISRHPSKLVRFLVKAPYFVVLVLRRPKLLSKLF